MNYLIVQLTGSEALFARFHLKRGALVLDGASRETIDQDHTLVSLLAESTAASGPETERVILVLPANHLFMRELELPISDRRKIRELLPLEMKGETAFDSEELVFDSLQLGEGKTLAIWIKHREVVEKIALMTEHGVEPEIVTAAPFCWHFLLPDEAAGNGHIAVTDGDSLAVFRDGKPLWFRALQEGELFLQLTRTFAALEISSGVKVEKVLLHGAAARDISGLPEGPPVFSPLPGNPEMNNVLGDNPTVALDLAGAYAIVRSVTREDPVNFRSGDLAYTAGRQKALKRLRLSMILCGVLLLLLIGETSLRFFLVNRDLNSVNDSIRGIYRQVFPNRKKPVDEVAELRSEIKRLGAGPGSMSPLRTLKALAHFKGEEVTGLFEVEMDGDKLRVRGDARSAAAVNVFRERAAAVFSDVEVGEIKSRPDGSVTFLFRGTIREGGR